MDRQTLNAYETAARQFAEDWHAQPAGADLHETVLKYFQPGPTADIGCGSGRDTAWLTANGFPAIGIDPSEGLLVEARRRYPELEFRCAALPELACVADDAFANVLCETVIMHLEPAVIGPAMRKLITIIRPGGVLYLTWRVTENANRRDEHGRLYWAFDPKLVREALSAAEILLDEAKISESSGKTIHRIVARKIA
jgi:SAM-dependent methyltransferase